MTHLLPGTEVEARGLRWEVVTSDSLGLQTLYRLRCIESALRGQELDLLYPFEAIAPVIHVLNPEQAAPLRNWLVYHQAFLLEQALGQDTLLAVQPGRLRLEPYQLVPVLRAIRMSRVRLLLADGVGLGKTIQAGLILTELVARRVAHRILIVCPAGSLLQQWKLEMSDRFGLRLDVIDRARLEEIRRSTELGANPFDHIPLGLVSLDFLKQERVLELLERASYDVAIIDEAHHCMDLGAVQEREDSQRRRLAEVLARRCDSLLLLTATPHDGNDRSFASLCELLDASLIDSRGQLRGERYRSHVVRRLKHHIIDPQTLTPKFKERLILPRSVVASAVDHPEFVALQRELTQLVASQLRRAFRAKRYSDVLAFLTLLKRSVSTVEACKATLTVVAERLQQILTQGSETQESRRQRLRTLRDYQRKLERFGTMSLEEEQEQNLLQVEDLAQQLVTLQREIQSGSRTLNKFSDIVQTLDRLIELAEQAVEQDPKLEQLVTELADIRKQEPQANVLIYTEYVDSQTAAVNALRRAGVGEVLSLNGEDRERDRHEIIEKFRTQSNLILVSTDTTAEGLNLQQRCHHLIHLELPFNPNRLEQRNGRIDRFGQEREPVVRYLFLHDTFEERILLRLIAKYERQRSRLTFVPNTLGLTASTDAAAAQLLKGLMDEDQKLFHDDTPLFDFSSAEENEGTDEATRELLEEIDRSLKGFEQAARTNSWLGELGVNAENRLLAEAQTARELGQRVSAVDLANFAIDAVNLHGGEVQQTDNPDIFTLRLPPAWSYGLNELPGYDADNRLLRLTTNLDIASDERQNSVGFLGRAHPLVRRALDRVRNLSFGGTSGQDPRASAVKADIPTPTLLFTYLGRVSSKAGRELERVLAVKIDCEGTTEFYDASNWLDFADRKRAIKTTDIWKQHFQSWGDAAVKQAQQVAQTKFLPIAEAFIQGWQRDLAVERSRQDEWFKQRVNDIIAEPESLVEQLDLFSFTQTAATEAIAPSTWRSLSDPAERLAAFALDRSQSSRLRSEADGVLRIYRQRLAQIETRLSLSAPEVIPLGVLMLVPEGNYGT